MPKGRNDPKEWTPVKLLDNKEYHGGRLGSTWKYVLLNPASYSVEIFAKVSVDLIFHPERNSKNIRRADILADTDAVESIPTCEEVKVGGMICTRVLRRRLMPRNPNLDRELEQTCYLYAIEGEQAPSLVIYLSHFKDGRVPYYVPDVRGIAFELRDGKIYIAYLPLFEVSTIDERLERIALNLLKTIHRHCLGTQAGYKKRVQHDLIVDKVAYQDLYITLKNRHAKTLIENWAESTDPLKHVFEDISLATFLILLWSQDRDKATRFVDVGCGNGVLVYLLITEGYEGYGFDARRRKSWDTFPSHVQDKLHEKILIPHFLCSSYTGEHIHDGNFGEGVFLISNHADELTPWTPILAALTSDSGFLAIPCCEHDFSGVKSGGGVMKPSSSTEGVHGRYAMYCAWIGEISRSMGWTVEREMLRIPSTRNVGIVGRKIDCQKDKEKALQIIQELGGHNGVNGFIDRALGLKDKVQRGH